MFSSLSNRNYRLLWLGMVAMMGAMQMQMLARGYLTYDLTDNNAALLGLVNAANAVPLLILGLFGGAIADRLERKRIMQFGQVFAAMVALFVAVSITTGTVTWYHLLGAAIGHGCLMSFLMPARQAIIPQVVGHDQITNAMALNAAGMSMTTLMAPTVGGSLYAFVGPEGVYYLISGLLISAVFLTGLLPKLTYGQGKSGATMVTDIKAGLSYIRRSHIVLVLVLLGLSTTMLAMPFRFLLPVFVVDIYGRGPNAMGMLLSLMGLGTLIGSLFMAAIGNWNRGLLLICGSLLSGIILMLVASFPYFFLAVGLMVFLGVGDAGRRALNQALVMELSEDTYRGRVWSVFQMNFGLMSLGVLPAGVVAEVFGGQIAIGILAVLLMTTAIVALLTQRQLRQLQ